MVELLGDSERPVRDDSAESTDEKRVRVDSFESTEEKRIRVDSFESAEEKLTRVDSFDEKRIRVDSVDENLFRVDSEGERTRVDSFDEKRIRVDSDESTGEKRIRVDSSGSGDKKRVRDECDDESDLDSPLAKRLKDDLLCEIDDSDPDPLSQDLDSVMRSFESELSASVTIQGSGEPQPDLGYLLEASDDELGLPPPPSTTESVSDLVRVSSDSSGVGEFWGFDDPIPSYNSFELDTGELAYTPVDTLFEYSDAGFESSDLLPRRTESLPAAD